MSLDILVHVLVNIWVDISVGVNLGMEFLGHNSRTFYQSDYLSNFSAHSSIFSKWQSKVCGLNLSSFGNKTSNSRLNI